MAAVGEQVVARANALAEGLYPHQLEGVAFLLGRRRALLTDDMGLGKTRQSIIALTEASERGPYLVVCPASLKRNWVREIEIVLPEPKCAIVGPAEMPPEDFDGWVVLNYDILDKHLAELLSRGWSGIVFDEAHYLKNYRSKRSRAALRLVREIPGDPVVHALTGTPLTNRPRDLFPLLQIADHPLGRSFASFAKRYCDGFQSDYGLVADGATNLDELVVQLHGVMLRRTKDEVLDLPPKLRTWLDIEIHPRAVEKLNEPVRALANSSRRERGRTEEERRSQGVLLGALTTARRKLATLKSLQTTDFLQSIVDQGEKVIVFSAFMPPTLRFARHFGDAAVTITGGVPAAERQNRVDRFQEDDDVRVLAANLHVGGVGLNLTAARQVVFNDLDWTPANHWQAEDRAYRIGQTGTVNVTYMIGVGTVDEFVRTVLQRKARVIDDLVEGKALGPELDTDVLGELKRMLTAMPALASGDVDPARVTELLTQARAAYVAEQDPADANTPAKLPYSEEAVQALAAALSGPKRERYRAVSSSDASKAYELEVIGADVSCSCRGFQYRGSCQHARKLKDAVAGDKALPKGFVRVTP
jgi:SWI/SNF-related matrix-associated actin-dependent regulator 1 of chromatin subfamily A